MAPVVRAKYPRPVESLIELPLGECIGAGGFAAVFALGDERVVKIAHVAHDLARARIAREAVALTAIGPPAVPKLHGTGILDDGRSWLAMDRIAGASLSDLVAAGPMSARVATQLGIAMLDALAVVHAAGFVHRDLKPENLIVNPETGIAILDLGLARKLPTDPLDPTRTGVQVGSLEYMAPEQIADSASVDERSDLYAFGCILFELLAGKPPFVADLARAHTALRPPHLEGVPIPLDQLVQECLAKEPAHRPSSATRLRAQLIATQSRNAARTTTTPISIIRESKQPVVLVYAELPRVDRALLGLFTSRRLIVVSQRGRRVIAAALAGEHGDPAAIAIAVARDLVAKGARVALHLENLFVGSQTSGLQGEAIENPATWLPSAWTGVAVTPAFSKVYTPAPAARVEVFGRETLLGALASDASVALIGSVSTAPATGPVIVTNGVPQSYLVTRERVAGPAFALVVGDPGVGKSTFAAELAVRLRDLDVEVHVETLAHGARQLRGVSGVRAIGDALRTAARSRPLAVILDDLHLADHELLDALEYATLGGEPLALWVLGIASPRIDVRRPSLGARAERHRRDELAPLDEVAAVALAAKLLEPAEYPPQRALRQLAMIAQGNPLHLAMLSRALHDVGAIRDRVFDVSAIEQLSPVALGPWLAARELSGLAIELVALARICAVLGAATREQLVNIVEAVEAAGGATTTIDAGVGLAELEAAGLLVATADGFVFRQNLVEEGIYATTDESERLAIHRAALAVGTRDVARHAEAIGDRVTAARAFAALAEPASSISEAAWQGALRNLPERDVDRARALLGRAQARAEQQRTRDAIADARDAIELANELGQSELVLDAQFALARILDRHGDFARSAQIAEVALVRDRTSSRANLAAARILFRSHRTAEAADKLRSLDEIEALSLLAPALVQLRELDEAEHVFTRLIAAIDRVHLGAAYADRARLWSAKGEPERAIEDLRLAIQMAREVGHTALEHRGTYDLAEHRLWQGALDEALQLAQRSVALQASDTRADRILLARVLAARSDVPELLAVLAGFERDELSSDDRTIIALAKASTDESAYWDPLLDALADMPTPLRLELHHLAAQYDKLSDERRHAIADLLTSDPIWSARAHHF